MPDIYQLKPNYTAVWPDDFTSGRWHDVLLEGAFPATTLVNGVPWLTYTDQIAYSGYRLMPRFVLDPDEDFEVTVPFRYSSGKGKEYGFSLYSGEWNYCGLYISANDGVFVHNLSPDQTDVYNYVKSAGWGAGHTDIAFRIKYLAASQATQLYISADGGAFELVYTRTVPAFTPWPKALSLWLSGAFGEGSNTWYLKLGAIVITRGGSNSILTGAGDYYVWGHQWDVSHYWPVLPSFGTIDYYNWPAGIDNEPDVCDSSEGMPMPGGLTYMWANGNTSPATFMGGAWVIRGPRIVLDAGQTLDKLRVWGYQGGNGSSIKTRILNSSEVVVRDNINFDGGYLNPTTVDLSSLSGSVFYLEFVASNPNRYGSIMYGSDDAASYHWAPLVQGFILTGAGGVSTSPGAAGTQGSAQAGTASAGTASAPAAAGAQGSAEAGTATAQTAVSASAAAAGSQSAAEAGQASAATGAAVQAAGVSGGAEAGAATPTVRLLPSGYYIRAPNGRLFALQAPNGQLYSLKGDIA